MDYQLLLLEDIRKTGRKGEVVKVKAGFARNFLIPQSKAVVADKRTLRMQDRLRDERAKQAVVDRKISEEVAAKLAGLVCAVEVKVDTIGNMYGSVSSVDIVEILSKEGISVEKQFIQLPHPIRKLGEYRIVLNLKEDVQGSFLLQVNPDREIELRVVSAVEEASYEPQAQTEEETEENENSSEEE